MEPRHSLIWISANTLRAGCPFFCRSAASARFQNSCVTDGWKSASPHTVATRLYKCKPSQEEEEIIQFSLSMRKELRKQLARLASDADMTMRAFALNALKEEGAFRPR